MSELGEVGLAEANVASEVPKPEESQQETAPKQRGVESTGEPESAFDKLFPEESPSRDMAMSMMGKLDKQGVVTNDQSREWASVSIATILSRYTSEELARLSNEVTDKTIMSLLSPVTKIIQTLMGE